MAAKKKLRVMVIYGGRSGEHEVSLVSAASVIRNLDRERFEVVPVSIDRDGRWRLNDLKLLEQATQPGSALPVYKDAPEVVLPAHPLQSQAELVALPSPGGKVATSGKVDVVFPVMHGPYCEDGSIQGLLELADVAYVGAGVLGSAVGMDKDVAKRLVSEAGLSMVPYVAIRTAAWQKQASKFETQVAEKLGFPVFVKPASLGSSVGVHKVKAAKDLRSAIEDAFRFDTKVLVEKAIRAREIEISALEDPNAEGGVRLSVPGEIVPTHEFYSYEAKYLDENGARLLIPAKLSEQQVKESQTLARAVFQVLECEGMARVDLFLDQDTGKFYFNEVNTIPGFTSISMYPKLFEASGITYQELLSRLIELAVARQERKSKLVRERE